MTDFTVTPIPAAAIILARGSEEGLQVLLLRRGARSSFMPNAYVFPGGSIDAGDSTEEMFRLCAHLDDAQSSKRLGVTHGGLKFFVGAVRECFEECGILFAYDATDQIVDLLNWDPQKLSQIRSEIYAGRLSFAAFCKGHGLRPAVDVLRFSSHWVTPAGMPRRFDTRFFIAGAPDRQAATLTGHEMSDLRWISPAQAIAEHAQKKVQLMYPTRVTLSELAAFPGIGALLEFADRPREITPAMPELSSVDASERPG